MYKVFIIVLTLITVGCSKAVVAETVNSKDALEKVENWTEKYDAMLKLHVKASELHGIKSTLVDYSSLRKTTTTSELRTELDRIPAVKGLDKKQRLAFWINAYNFLTIEKVVNNPKIKKLNDLGSIFKSVWKQDVGTIGGRKVTLDSIEHQILRKEFTEPRIHAAIVCAAVSCPDLKNEAFTAEKIDVLLNEQVEAFFTNDKKGLRVDTQNRVVYLSKLLDWFKEDFRDGQVIAWLIEQNMLSSKYKDYEIKFLDYDWRLNSFRAGIKEDSE